MTQSLEEYKDNKIKDYTYWEVYLYKSQGNLGRCYVWCKRADALDLPDATLEEREELFVVLRDVEDAIKKAFNPDILNYAFLGNTVHHLHGHIIPRYPKPVIFEGVEFTDEKYGHNYQTNTDFKVSLEDFKKIQNHLTKFLA